MQYIKYFETVADALADNTSKSPNVAYINATQQLIFTDIGTNVDIAFIEEDAKVVVDGPQYILPSMEDSDLVIATDLTVDENNNIILL